MTEQTPNLELVACGILRKEIQLLAGRNNWPVKLTFLDSSLHIDLDRLSNRLTGALGQHGGLKKLVAYGVCHPKMDDYITQADAIRVPCQNCVELLLGKERFTEKLAEGAFFLFEDWAIRWEHISYQYFQDWEIMRDIFQGSHSYILCIETPCSHDFEASAHDISERLELPLVWDYFALDQLESSLNTSISDAIARADQ